MHCPRIVSGGFFRLQHVAAGGWSSHDERQRQDTVPGFARHLWSRVLWVTLARTVCFGDMTSPLVMPAMPRRGLPPHCADRRKAIYAVSVRGDEPSSTPAFVLTLS